MNSHTYIGARDLPMHLGRWRGSIERRRMRPSTATGKPSVCAWGTCRTDRGAWQPQNCLNNHYIRDPQVVRRRGPSRTFGRLKPGPRPGSSGALSGRMNLWSHPPAIHLKSACMGAAVPHLTGQSVVPLGTYVKGSETLGSAQRGWLIFPCVRICKTLPAAGGSSFS